MAQKKLTVEKLILRYQQRVINLQSYIDCLEDDPDAEINETKAQIDTYQTVIKNLKELL